MQHINFIKNYLLGSIPILHEHNDENDVSIVAIIPYLILKNFFYYHLKFKNTPLKLHFKIRSAGKPTAEIRAVGQLHSLCASTM
jgi:hypothetical protein